jgi:hypothetical protein
MPVSWLSRRQAVLGAASSGASRAMEQERHPCRGYGGDQQDPSAISSTVDAGCACVRNRMLVSLRG